ncbi:MAG TPA: DUF4389 domain-containing protein [Actinomycetota bacterium]|nr:DUF4389 domain-containing protein [Actinomycetota bacterium]
MDAVGPIVHSGAGSYPVRVDLEAPHEIARWRPLVHWLLAIPHMIVLYAIETLVSAVTFVAFFAILFTKKYPEGLFRFSAMASRYNWRVSSYVLFMREQYPAFEFPMEMEDPGDDPATYSIEYPQEMSRWMPLVKWFLAIPHYFALLVVAVGAFFAMLVSFFAVLFTGAYPDGMRNYLIGAMRYFQRVSAYVYLMTDVYPPFSLH